MRQKITVRTALLATILIAVCTVAIADWTQGIAAFNSKQFRTAAEHFTEITHDNPTWPGGFYMLGRCHLELGQKDEAIENLQVAHELDPSDTDTIIALGQALIADGQFRETRDLLEPIAPEAMPAQLRSQSSILLASAMLGEGDVDSAVIRLQERIAKDPSNPALLRILGKAWSETDNLEGAFSCYSKAFSLDSEESTALAAATTALALQGNATTSEEKIQWSKEAHKIAGQLATTFPKGKYDLMAGQAALGAEDLEAAEGWLRAAISKNKNDSRAWYFLGRTLSNQARNTEAYEAFSTALQHTSDDDLTRRIHGRMGQIAACRLDLEGAAQHYRAAKKMEQAQQLDELVTQYADALAQREKSISTVQEIRNMERQLADLGDDQGVAAMQEQAQAEMSKIAEIERNLEAVRSALCR